MKKSKRWRVNYFITYNNNSVVTRERKRLHDLLKTVAHLQGIEIEIENNNLTVSEEISAISKFFADSVVDTVYFRSLPDTAILPKDFRKMMSVLFLNHQYIRYSDDFVVGQQLLKHLPDYPFPYK